MPAARHLEHDRLHFPGSPFGIDESGSPADGLLFADRPAARYVAWEHHTEQIAPPPHIARRLGAGTAAALVTATRYLMTADGQPVQLATSYEPAGLTEGTAVALPEQGSFAGRGVIERMRSIGIEIDQVLEELSVRTCLLAEAAALAMPAGCSRDRDRAHPPVRRRARRDRRHRDPGRAVPAALPVRRAGPGRMIRPARPADVPAIYQLIRDLAAYERALPEVTGTLEDLQQSLFGSDPAVFAHVAEHDGEVAGFALWFLNYSTWQCQQGIYLEDLYVRPELRGAGDGRQLLTELAAAVRGARVRPARLGGAGLERAGPRLLRQARRDASG